VLIGAGGRQGRRARQVGYNAELSATRRLLVRPWQVPPLDLPSTSNRKDARARPARVVKLVDAGDSKSPAARRAGSIPAPGTTRLQELACDMAGCSTLLPLQVAAPPLSAADVYRKTGFLYTSPVTCIENRDSYTRRPNAMVCNRVRKLRYVGSPVQREPYNSRQRHNQI
jgi:hypothetical protein